MELDDKTIEGLISEWRDDARMHSFEHTMLAGPAFQELMTAKWKLAPFIFRRLQNESGWMGYQGLLRRLTGADIFVGEVRGGWRGYDVKATAELWLKWGKEHGFLETDVHRWKRGDEYTQDCYKCLKNGAEFARIEETGKDGSFRRVFNLTCPDCGVIEELIQWQDEDGAWCSIQKRLWRGPDAIIKHIPSKDDKKSAKRDLPGLNWLIHVLAENVGWNEWVPLTDAELEEHKKTGSDYPYKVITHPIPDGKKIVLEKGKYVINCNDIKLREWLVTMAQSHKELESKYHQTVGELKKFKEGE